LAGLPIALFFGYLHGFFDYHIRYFFRGCIIGIYCHIHKIVFIGVYVINTKISGIILAVPVCGKNGKLFKAAALAGKS